MKILYVEDEVAHVELAQRTLENKFQDEFTLYHTDTLEGALQLLNKEPDIDLVLTDYRLPDGSGLDLIVQIRERKLPPAVVLITGQGDQEIAVAALKAGAADYLVKQSDYLHRLPVVISNAVAQNRLLREQAALHEAEIRYQSLVEQTPAVVFLDATDENETTLYINPRVQELTGYSPEEWQADDFIWEKNIHPDDRERIQDAAQRTHKQGERFQEEYRFIRRDGRVIWIKEDTNLIRDKDGNPLYSLGILVDITKEKENESALQRQLSELTVLHEISMAGAESNLEDEIIQRVVKITSKIYNEVCGVLLLNSKGDTVFAHPSYFGADVSKWRESGAPSTEGVVGKVLSLGKSLRLDDVSTEPSFVEVAPGMHSELCVPIRVDQRIIGALNVESRKFNAFDREDEQFLNTVAASLGTALERLRLLKEEKQRAIELDTLYQVTKLLPESLKPEVIAQNLIDNVGKLIGYEFSGVTVVDENTGELIPLAVSKAGLTETEHQNTINQVRDLHIKPGKGLAGWVIQNNLPVRVGDVRKDPRYLPLHENILSVLCVPLATRDRVIGAIIAESRKQDAYTSHDESLLTALAGSAAITLENARLYEAQHARRKEAEALQQATASLGVHIELNPLLDQILESLLMIIPYDSASIFLDDKNGSMDIVAVKGFPQKENIVGKKIYMSAKWRELTEERKSLILPDTQLDPYFEKWDSSEVIRGWMGIPMITRDHVIGYINLESHKVNTFTERDATLAQTFANSAAVAIQNSLSFLAQREQLTREAAILNLMRSAASSLDLDQVLHTILDQLSKLLRADAGSIQLLDDDQLLIAAAVGFDTELFTKNKLAPLKNFPLNQLAITSQKAIRVDDTTQDERYVKVPGLETRSFLVIPLISKDVAIGLITLDNTRPSYFTDRDVDITVAIANHASIAIENARLYDESQSRLKEMETINRVSTSMRTTQSQSDMLNILLEETLKLLKAENGSVWLYNHTTNMLVQRVTIGAAKNAKQKQIRPGEGIVGHVFQSGKIHISTELKSDPLFIKTNLDIALPGHGGICIPIQSTAGVLGALTVQMKSSPQITRHVNLLTTLAEIAGNSIHRADLFEQSQDQVRKLTTLRDIDSAIASSTDLRVTLNILTDHTLKHLKVDAVDILLYHRELQNLTYLAGAGFNTLSPSRSTMRIGEGLAGQVVMQGKIEHVTDLQSLDEVKRDSMLIREKFVAYIGIPLIVKGQVKGVFEVFNRTALSLGDEWMQFLQTLAGQAAIAIDNSQLFDNLQRSNQELTQAYDTTLEGWARALELRDRETEGHTRRVTELTTRLARHMGIGEEELVNIYRGVLLHDIGKMGVPDQILRKTGPLTHVEWSEMRQHPQYAFDLLAPISFLRSALDIPYCHHEHWDGSGYPRGLKGEQIPLSARIFSVVDIWDALLSDRPYRKAWGRERVIKYLHEISGQTLDPKVVTAFLKMVAEDEQKPE